MRMLTPFPVTMLLAVFLAFVPERGDAGYTEIDVKGGGSVVGRVTFQGELPPEAVEQIAIAKNPEVCGDGYRDVIWIDVKDGALRGAFVFIDGIKKGKKWPRPGDIRQMLDQKGCRFLPWAQVVRRGPITIRNSDKGVLHNVNMRENFGVEKGRVVKRTMFNVAQPGIGEIVEEIMPRRSSYISINCEAHNFMFAYILAPEHPYAVVVEDDGSFVLDNIPPGTYTIKVWHPKLGVRKTKVTVPAGGSVKADFEY